MQDENIPDVAGHTPGFSQFVVALDALAALVVLAMVAIVNTDVFGRWLFNLPLAGALEMTEMGVVAAVYLALAHCIATGRITRSDGLLTFLDRRRPKFGEGLRLLFNLSGVVVLLFIAYGQYPRLIDAWQYGYFKGNPGVFTAPRWPLDAIMLIGVLAGALQFLLLALRNISRIRA